MNKKKKLLLNWFLNGGGGSTDWVIYNKSTFPDISDFTVNGSVTPTAGSGTINFTGGTDVFSNTLDLTAPYTMLENYSLRIRATITAGAKTGFTFGTRAQSSAPHSMVGYFNNDFIGIAAGSTMAEVATEVALATTVGDLLEFTLTKQGLLVTVTGRNVTTGGATVQTTYTFNITTAASEPLTPNTGRFAIGTRGSTFSVSEFYIASNVTRDARIAIVGDSITEGYGASAYDTAFARLMNVSYPTTIIHAGENDRTTAIILRLPQLIELNPTHVILSTGVNDLVNFVAVGTIMTNIATIVAALEAEGIIVYHLLNYSNVTNSDTLRTAIKAAYPAKFINPWIPDASNFIADFIHPNDTGHSAIHSAMVASGYFSAVAPIDPFSLTPLCYWDNGPTYMAADGSQWTDRMGNYNLTAAGAARPTYNASGQNGLPSFSFNGTAQVLTGGRITQIQNASSFTMVMVSRRGSMTHYSTATLRTEFLHITGNFNYGIVSNGLTTYGTHARSNVYNYSVIVYDGSKTLNTNRIRMWTNGVEQDIGFSGTIPATTENDAASIIRFGRFLGGFVAGEMSEAIIYTGVLTVPQIAGVNNFLKAKYAL